jgi:hypothetical protein
MFQGSDVEGGREELGSYRRSRAKRRTFIYFELLLLLFDFSDSSIALLLLLLPSLLFLPNCFYYSILFAIAFTLP